MNTRNTSLFTVFFGLLPRKAFLMSDRGQLAVAFAVTGLLLRSLFRRKGRDPVQPSHTSDPSPRTTYTSSQNPQQATSFHPTPPVVDFSPGLLAAWSAFALLAFSVVLAAVQGWWNMCALLFAVAVIEVLSLFHQVSMGRLCGLHVGEA